MNLTSQPCYCYPRALVKLKGEMHRAESRNHFFWQTKDIKDPLFPPFLGKLKCSVCFSQFFARSKKDEPTWRAQWRSGFAHTQTGHIHTNGPSVDLLLRYLMELLFSADHVWILSFCAFAVKQLNLFKKTPKIKILQNSGIFYMIPFILRYFR